MAQPPPDHPHPQLQLPPQFRNPFELIFDERTGAINYNHIRPYFRHPLVNADDLCDPLVMRRPRRTRTTFTSAQVAELEQHFLQGKYLNSSRLAELSAKLTLGTAQVKIWFKNRRRRYKVESYQHEYCTCDSLSLSPPAPKSDTNEKAISCGSSSSLSIGGPPSLQSLSLNGNSRSTPNTLTLSPTSTTPTTISTENYGESTFNPYCYNNHHPSHHCQPLQTHVALTHPYAAATSHYYPPPLSLGEQQNHSPEHQQQYHISHSDQLQIQHKTKARTGFAIVDLSRAMSPNSKIYEPLTPINEESSCIINISDDSNKIKPELKVSSTNDANGNYKTLSNSNPLSNKRSGTSIVNITEDRPLLSSSFEKFQKVKSHSNESDFQNTIGTLMHAYNNHRNTSTTNSQQFATYCFN